MGSLTDAEWREGVGVLVMTMSAVSYVIIRSFLFMLFSVVQVEGCLDDYPLTHVITTLSNGNVSWHNPFYKNSSTGNITIGDSINFIVQQTLSPDSTFWMTVAAENEVGIGMPSSEVEFCELF